MLLQAPKGTLDDEIMDQLPDLFVTLYNEFDTMAVGANKCPPESGIPPEMCRVGYTKDEVREIAIERLGMPLAFKETPAKFATSVNVLAMATSVTSGIGSLLWGALSDKIGRKVCTRSGTYDRVVCKEANEKMN